MALFRFPICTGLRYKSNMKPKMKPDFAALCLLFFLAFALPAQAEAYKCRKPDGSTQISSEPCTGGSSTVRTVEDEPVPEATRQQAERNAERQRRRADQLQAERRAGEAEERRARERELERERRASKQPETVYVPTPAYIGGAYVPPYARPPRPVHPDDPAPSPKPGKPVDLYKVPNAPRSGR